MSEEGSNLKNEPGQSNDAPIQPKAEHINIKVTGPVRQTQKIFFLFGQNEWTITIYTHSNIDDPCSETKFYLISLLKIYLQDGSETHFKIRKSTAFKKLMDAYCDRVGKDAGSLRFLYDGTRILEDNTPKDVK